MTELDHLRKDSRRTQLCESYSKLEFSKFHELLLISHSSLGGNLIGDEGASALGKGLEVNSTLENLRSVGAFSFAIKYPVFGKTESEIKGRWLLEEHCMLTPHYRA